jgi:Uma2 family endonuclease
MAAMAAPPAAGPEKPGEHPPRTVRELFDALPLMPGLRVEIIEGKLIVSPAPAPKRFLTATALDHALIPLCQERGWKGTQGGPNLRVEGRRDSLAPDFVVWSPDCELWGNELPSAEVIMTAEVVSPGAVRGDHKDKVRLYALGRIPVHVLIDTIAKTPSVTVHSDIEDGEYRTITTVPLGRRVSLPSPVGVELDTSILMV